MNFKAKFRILLLLVSIVSSDFAYSQTRTVRLAEKKKQKIEQRQKKAYQKARVKSAKDKFEMQTEQTKKRMKESHKRARQNNALNNKPFWHKLTNRKRKPK
ncbi:MAG: hypothetical protein JXB00_03630 [Bacteroidales bacterium]|nr:hypothetical protein [Bacteroidales bacterium]